MREMLKTITFAIDKVWGSVDKGTSSTSYARAKTRELIMGLILTNQVITHDQKLLILRECGYVNIRKYARLSALSQRTLNKMLLVGYEADESVTYKDITYIQHPHAVLARDKKLSKKHFLSKVSKKTEAEITWIWAGRIVWLFWWKRVLTFFLIFLIFLVYIQFLIILNYIYL